MDTKKLGDGSSPIISFILTCRDFSSDVVKECLDSILFLSLRPFEREIIVVDDGSGQDLMGGLMGYGNDIIYIRQKKQGLGAARNTGLRMAAGRYIQFVEGDGKLFFDAYERCLDLVRYYEPDIVLFDSSDKNTESRVYEMTEPVDGTQFVRHNDLHAGACGYVFSRKILMDLRFTPSLEYEDEVFTPQLFLRAEKIYSVNTVAYLHSKKSGSTAYGKDKRTVIKRLNDLEMIIYHLQDIASSMPQNERLAMERRVNQLTMEYIFNTIRFTRSAKQLNSRIERLKTKGLFPLPDKSYTKKYSIFRKLTKSRIIRYLLTIVLKS